MRRLGAWIAAGGLAMAALLPGCSSSGSDGAAGVTVTEVAIDIGEYETVAGVAAWQGGAVAVTGDGSVFRSPDGRQWDQLETTGLVGGEVARASTSVGGIAAGDDFLLAAGTRTVETGEETAELVPLVWRSDDGEQWEQLEPSGLDARFLDFVVADGDGFVVFGSEEVPPPPDYEPTDEEAETLEEGELPASIDVTSTWRSGDGTSWEKVGENVLPPGENSFEGVAGAAIVGDQLLAALGTECNGCYDDYALVLSKSEDGGESWRELDANGLDDLELANSDVVPRLASFDDTFVAVGTSGGDDTVATLWQSEDGRTWTGERRLGGPEFEEYAEDVDAVATTDSGVIALEISGDRLIVWQVEL